MAMNKINITVEQFIGMNPGQMHKWAFDNNHYLLMNAIKTHVANPREYPWRDVITRALFMYMQSAYESHGHVVRLLNEKPITISAEAWDRLNEQEDSNKEL